MCTASAVIFLYCGKKKSPDEVFAKAPQIPNTYTQVHDIAAATPHVSYSDRQCMLPSWLTANPEMIFTPSSIKIEELLGQGQYGTVLRGKLYQGKAV